MASKSSANLLDGCSDDVFDFRQAVKSLPRVITAPGIITDVDEDTKNDEDLSSSRSVSRNRKVIVANFLPLNSVKDQSTGEWCFTWDEDSLLLQLKDGFSADFEVIYVGSLKVDIDPDEQENVAQKLLKELRCIPTFLSPELQNKFYHGFCKQQLWPLFHYMIPICLDKGELFDRSLFQAYVSANKTFADKVMEAINSDDDYVWVHDYHLMLLPTFLRKRLNQVKLGFFLHSPFPSAEIYRTLPVRDEILKSLLNSDVIGFQTFDYARHFLSCCSRMLGINYESKRGYIGLEYFGRTVSIKILPVGVHIGRLESVLQLPATVNKVREIEERYKGKTLLLGVDDMDIFKGISLKLLALELLLERNPKLRGGVVLVQIVNPARSAGKDVKEAREEAISIAERVNQCFGTANYKPVVLIDYPIPFYEKIAFYVAAECCIVNAVRDGMNLVPYEYIVCRQGTEEMDKCRGIDANFRHKSTLIVSEFVGCSPSLSGAFRVNPWCVEDVADAFYQATDLGEPEKQLRHEKHYRYVSSHNIAYWARSFLQDLERACKDHYNQRCWAIGFGLGFRVVSLSHGFRKLSLDHIVPSYKKANRRAIFLDYDGTIMPESSISKIPSTDIISMLNNLCGDPKNTVFIVSGRGWTSLGEWFASCEGLGIAAEHGYFIRWSKEADWETSSSALGSEWKKIAEPVMKLYSETTDGSFIETKESALVWHYQYADHDFGSCQAKELLDHLESVLANEPVVVKRGQHIVEVKPQGVSKGLVVEKLIRTMLCDGKPPDLLMCIGDDRSDEDMFETINSTASSSLFPIVPEVFACTVGQKPSKAKYFVDDTSEVLKLLKRIAAISTQNDNIAVSRVNFDVPLELAD
ncbi:probable alpha,alpha-trehalose-phosphate synthase [UDP-forming] 9 [Ananas comosus]|uniref:alpha,alpha-trehalose-phosphate synthase (UDP-forming) n=1 Tax=Ananas comosus TaxID=4615 RepID=A0A6P5EJ84_ANACO|nr:probable alpha,alpha-trehalose-phosphate synthase [UDP-forming] 9 [Ananas comosus]XP_020083572.1 probable alpha,alpha-trehalose-phosphate synthase [UDP-forming] 9 [Ananas comosus]